MFSPRGINLLAVVSLAILLVLPVIAAKRLVNVLGMAEVTGYFLLVSGLTCWFYWDDKKCALKGDQRTPEFLLHRIEFLGVWPSAFLAQRVLRHKSVKVRYQTVFWLIVAVHEAAAFDFMRDWQYSRNVLSRLFVYHAGHPETVVGGFAFLEAEFTLLPFAFFQTHSLITALCRT